MFRRCQWAAEARVEQTTLRGAMPLILGKIAIPRQIVSTRQIGGVFQRRFECHIPVSNVKYYIHEYYTQINQLGIDTAKQN